MSVNIEAPSLKPPRVSILSSAEIINIPGNKWWGGIEYRKLSANPAHGVDSAFDTDDVFVLEICPVDSEEKLRFPRTPSDRVQPFGIYATDDCSTYGTTAESVLDRATQKLVSAEAWVIEHELWHGTSTTNYSFADESESVGTGLHPLLGFATVDATVAEDRADGRGMVHLTPLVFDLLQQYRLFRREGNIWLSPHDNIVVPGRGYGPAGAESTSTIYGHPGIIQIVRSEVLTFPRNPEELQAQMDRFHNDLWAVAERVVAYIVPTSLGEDGETSVYSATVDIADLFPA